MGTCRSITAALFVAGSLGATALPSIAQSVEEEVAADPGRLGQNTAFLQAQGCCAREFSDRSELLAFAYWSGEFLFENWASAGVERCACIQTRSPPTAEPSGQPSATASAHGKFA